MFKVQSATLIGVECIVGLVRWGDTYIYFMISCSCSLLAWTEMYWGITFVLNGNEHFLFQNMPEWKREIKAAIPRHLLVNNALFVNIFIAVGINVDSNKNGLVNYFVSSPSKWISCDLFDSLNCFIKSFLIKKFLNSFIF